MSLMNTLLSDLSLDGTCIWVFFRVIMSDFACEEAADACKYDDHTERTSSRRFFEFNSAGHIALSTMTLKQPNAIDTHRLHLPRPTFLGDLELARSLLLDVIDSGVRIVIPKSQSFLLVDVEAC